jgi:gas vesicle protein
MEQTISFVLGVTTGLLAIMLISSFVGMLKIRNQILALQKINEQSDKELQDIHTAIDRQFESTDRNVHETHDHIMREIHEITDQIHRTIEEINRHMETMAQREREETKKEVNMLLDEIQKHAEAEHRIRYGDFNTLQKRIDELSRYTDSRFDKTIDALSLRMDTMFVQKENDTTILKS